MGIYGRLQLFVEDYPLNAVNQVEALQPAATPYESWHTQNDVNVCSIYPVKSSVITSMQDACNMQSQCHRQF